MLGSDFEEGGPTMLAKWTTELSGAGGPGMLDHDDKELSCRTASWGSSDFISRTELQAKADRYLVGGAAVFKMDVTWLEKPAGA
ncbi:hypothetical protein ABPG75_013163 [Micractinium tetrahymenae]